MNKIFSRLLIFCFLILSGSNLLANDKCTDTLFFDRGNEIVEIKHISKDRIEEYRSDSDFHYDIAPRVSYNLMERFGHWIEKILNVISATLNVIWYLKYVILGSLLALLVYIILKSRGTNWFQPHRVVNPINFHDQIHPESVDWENEIKNALSQKEFRLAVRYHFLLILKILSSKEYINWKDEKTNYDYIYEIKDQSLKNNFTELSRLYEAVWYGNFPISSDEYQGIEQDFYQFNTLLNT